MPTKYQKKFRTLKVPVHSVSDECWDTIELHAMCLMRCEQETGKPPYRMSEDKIGYPNGRQRTVHPFEALMRKRQKYRDNPPVSGAEKREQSEASQRRAAKQASALTIQRKKEKAK